MTPKHRASTAAVVFRPRHSSKRLRHTLLHTFVVAMAATTGFSLVYLQTTVQQIEGAFTVRDISSLVAPPPPPPPADPDDPLAGMDVNILIMGSDARDGENASLGGLANLGGMRADATMIMHISADRNRVELLAIPRDMRVKIPDCYTFEGERIRGWTTKFNVAFANGGRYGDIAEAAACAVNTATQFTGIEFDHFLVMDFAGFRHMVDAIGGVPMCIPQDVYSRKAKLDLKAGPQVLDGITALAWARARTGSGLGDGSDLHRIKRQQVLLEAMMRKTIAMNLLTDTGALTGFMREVANSLTLDEQLGDVGYLGGLAFSLRNLDTNNIYFATVPWKSAADGTGDILPTPAAQTMFDKLVRDLPLDPDYVPPSAPDPAPSPSPTQAPKPVKTRPGDPLPEPEPEPSAPVDRSDEVQEDIFSACT